MHASEVIESYIDDVVRLLPGRMREDVASELRSLLNEELLSRAKESGHAPDEALALALVRDYGRPNEAAARYHPPVAIVDPADSTNFLRAAILGALGWLLLSAVGKRLPPEMAPPDHFAEIGILSWLGLLVLAFGVKGWSRRRWPAKSPWRPRHRDEANRLGAAATAPIAAFFIAFYAAPNWMLDKLTGGRIDASWAAYTAEFQQSRLPGFLALMAALVGLLVFAAIQGRWSPLTRRLNIALNLAIACLLLVFAVDGGMFQSAQADQIARDVLGLVGLVYLTGVGAMIYGEIGRRARLPGEPAAAPVGKGSAT